MVISIERGAHLHMAQLMPVPLTIVCSTKSGLVLPFLYRLTWVVMDKGPLKGCCCVLKSPMFVTVVVGVVVDLCVQPTQV